MNKPYNEISHYSQRSLDHISQFKWYRRMVGGSWFKHQFTKDAEELTFPQGDTWWARYGKINRYSDVVETQVF